MSKTWKIVTTMLIAVVIPPGVAGWFLGYGLVAGMLRSLLREMTFWGWPNWIGASIGVAASALWFVLPWLGVVWLLIKIWESKHHRITEGKS